MQKTYIATVAAVLACASLQANASIITVQTAFSKAKSQTSANAYKDVVEQALLTQSTGYGTATVDSYAGISSGKLFGAQQDIAWKATVDFTVAAAGTWFFRTGVDFGLGGAMFLDGVALKFRSNDMFTGGTYGSSTSTAHLEGSALLSVGDHQLTIYGLDNCCGGIQDAQFRTAQTSYKTFAKNDGISPKVVPAAVPEPATLASLALGLGLIAGVRRRAKRK